MSDTRPRRRHAPPDTPPSAFEPQPATREPRTYKVIGPHRVNGTNPGGTFTALLSPEQEAALIEGGHIRPKETA